MTCFSASRFHFLAANAANVSTTKAGAGVCVTKPLIAMAATSATCVRKATNDDPTPTGVTVGVVDANSAVFSAGDMLTVDYNARSVGSAAAGAAGNAMYVAVVVRYAAV